MQNTQLKQREHSKGSLPATESLSSITIPTMVYLTRNYSKNRYKILTKLCPFADRMLTTKMEKQKTESKTSPRMLALPCYTPPIDGRRQSMHICGLPP